MPWENLFGAMFATFIVLFCLVFIRWAIKLDPDRRWLPHSVSKSRVESLDGLRGFLALDVVFSHALTYREYVLGGRRYWAWPKGGYLFHFTGSVAVSLFFAITAFLFWSQAIRLNGNFKLRDFYLRRFRRIYPLYAVVAITAFILCLLTPGRLVDGFVPTFIKSPISLAVPGIAPWRNVNGVSLGQMITQTWTLKLEILFYLLLPFLGMAVLGSGRSAWVGRLVTLAVVATFFLPRVRNTVGHITVPILAPFAVGILAAYLYRIEGLRIALQNRRYAIFSLTCLGGILALEGRSMLLDVVFLTGAFVPIALGNSLFGLLSTRTCRTMGDLSYSIYMTHLVVLYLIIAIVVKLTPLSTMPLTTYWIVIAVATLVVLSVSIVTHRLFERPYMQPRARVSPHG